MSTNLLQFVSVFGCTHEFSWPIRRDQTTCYQVCVRCGDEYEYNWKEMRRLQRLNRSGGPLPEKFAKSEWRPRSRRVAVAVPVQFWNLDRVQWESGILRNFSETGALVETDSPLVSGTETELMFELPSQTRGREDGVVCARGRVVRTAEGWMAIQMEHSCEDANVA